MTYTLVIHDDGAVATIPPLEEIATAFPVGEYDLTVTRRRRHRTLSQNRLMWLWFRCLEDKSGQPKEDFHTFYKARFLAYETVINDRVVTLIGGTRDLDTVRMTRFLEQVQAHAATEWGVTLPSPDDPAFPHFLDKYR
ncbi:MAG: hypothetical protein LIP02_06680 [Bacteroidales bacterium]|nr:hypothetical protein [Bacteroidales bacterium]